MRLLPRSEVKKVANTQIAESSHQRRSILDEITKLTKRLNLERQLAEKEKSALEEELSDFRRSITTRKDSLVTEVGSLESRKRELESSLEHLDVEKRKVEVSEREALVKTKFEELKEWEAKVRELDVGLTERMHKNQADEERIYNNFITLDAGRKEVIQRENSVTASEQSLVERMKSIDLAIQKRQQELVLREHDLDLREFEMKTLKEMYEKRIAEKPEIPAVVYKSMTFTTSPETYAGTS